MLQVRIYAFHENQTTDGQVVAQCTTNAQGVCSPEWQLTKSVPTGIYSLLAVNEHGFFHLGTGSQKENKVSKVVYVAVSI